MMENKIDAGKIIVQSHYRINYKIQPDQPLFMDCILDPYIRAQTLRKVVTMLMAGKIETLSPTEECLAYYVMHPFLRHVTINKINQLYDPSKLIGVYEI